MSKKILGWLGAGIVAGGLIWTAVFVWQNLRGVGPAIKPPPAEVGEVIDKQNEEDDLEPGEEEIQDKTDFALEVAEGFQISVLAEGLDGARVIKKGPQGNLWVSQTREGTISLIILEDGVAKSAAAVFKGLNKPHGLAFDPADPFILYIAEEDKISRARVYSEAPLERVIDLPSGGRHFTRTIEFGPGDKLYVSIGSSCDTCYEEDERRAAIYRMDRDGSNFEEYASGLRNAVFFDWSYVDGRMWATEMGRDLLGDDLPPDEINIVEFGGNYGWPICYGQNIHDSQFDTKQYVDDPCEDMDGSLIDLPAHSAPLGLAFVPEEGWPEEYWYDLIVAYHGSWNRSEPTGYKLVRIKLDEFGNYLGMEDFISGWLTDEGALGRPVDVLVEPGGVMYVTDDKAGVVYMIRAI